jgi:pimeloyl-ACP methyl ester carboxylesterase
MKPDAPFAALVACSLVACSLVAACGDATPPQSPASGPAQTAAEAAPPRLQPPPQASAREARVVSLAEDRSEIRYRVYGSGEPAVVFVHGWSCDSGYWDAQLNEFASRGTVVTLDLAGHGASDAKRRKDWSMANFGADVAAVVEDAKLARVILVGSSMGGTVALEAARRLPGRVVGVVGVDTFRDISTPLAEEQTGPILANMRKDFAKATGELVGGRFFTEASDPVLKRWIVEDMASAPPEVAIPAIEAYLATDYRGLLAELDVPIVAINSGDTPTDEAATRRVEPRFRVVELPGAGHFPMLEDPTTFNAVLSRIVVEWTRLEPVRNPLSRSAPDQ